jgi:hypothetical protein
MSVEALLQEALPKETFPPEVRAGMSAPAPRYLARLVGLQNVDLPSMNRWSRQCSVPGRCSAVPAGSQFVVFLRSGVRAGAVAKRIWNRCCILFLRCDRWWRGSAARACCLARFAAPIVSLLDQLWDAGRYWSADLGKPGEKYRQRLEEMLQRLRKPILLLRHFKLGWMNWLHNWQKIFSAPIP